MITCGIYFSYVSGFFLFGLCLVPHNITTELIFSCIVHSHGHHLWLHHLMKYLVIASLREVALRTQDRHQELWTHGGSCVLVGSQYSFSDSLSALPWRSASLARQPGCGPSQLPFDFHYEITQLLSLDGSSVQHTGQYLLVPSVWNAFLYLPQLACNCAIHESPSLDPCSMTSLLSCPSISFCFQDSQKMCAQTWAHGHSVCLGPPDGIWYTRTELPPPIVKP